MFCLKSGLACFEINTPSLDISDLNAVIWIHSSSVAFRHAAFDHRLLSFTENTETEAKPGQIDQKLVFKLSILLSIMGAVKHRRCHLDISSDKPL